MNRFVIGIGAAISLLIATDLIIHRTDGDSLIVSLTQIEEITFPTVNDTTYLISGDSLSVPLSQIDKITFSNVNDTPPTAETI